MNRALVDRALYDTRVTGQHMDGLPWVRFPPLGQPGAGSTGLAACLPGAVDRDSSTTSFLLQTIRVRHGVSVTHILNKIQRL